MQCGDANELTAYVEGLLSGDRARAVVRHVDECAACRKALAAAAGGVATRGRTPLDPAPLPVHGVAVVPDQLVRNYLRKDAPVRELALARFWSAAAILGLGAIGILGWRYAVPDLHARLVILGTFLLYEVGVYVALTRGHYHAGLPFVSMLVENGTLLAMTLVTMNGMPPGATGGPLMWVVLIMFTAIRATPWLCMVAGGLGAIGFAIPFAAQASENTTTTVPIGFAAGSGVAFCLLAGVAGATIARYLLTRAEAALREIREQDLFGKYMLHESLGSGGMGEVFRATYCPEGGFTRTVAVKQVRAHRGQPPRDQASLRDALRAEARLSSRLAHPNVVQVLDCGTFRGAFVLVMEFVDGVSLNRLLERGPMKLAPALLVGAELATALDYIHGRRDERGAALGLVHSDVNPPNVLISAIGEVKLCDFGVARSSSKTADWQRFAGKTAYAAPEQLRREPLDHRTDLYGLGLTLFEALTGERGPYLKTTHVRDLRPEVPAEIDVLLAALLSLDREMRPDSAAVVLSKLIACLNNLAPASVVQQELCEAIRLTNTR